MTRARRGMIHGRFQPFHNGHLEYLSGAAERSDDVFVGITNPDPRRIKEEPSDPLRHLPESNPGTYAERLLMVKAAAIDLDPLTAQQHQRVGAGEQLGDFLVAERFAVERHGHVEIEQSVEAEARRRSGANRRRDHWARRTAGAP